MTIQDFYKKKIIQPDDVEKKVASLRQEKKTIVTLNGSFDLLQSGHIYIIYEAKKMGDALILALNSDSSIQAYKDKKRPIISLEERLKMVAALEFVDFVTWFEETDPRAILQKIKPDIHVNGAEYGENCIEADVVKKQGGKLHLVQRIDGLSTSSIVKKIQGL